MPERKKYTKEFELDAGSLLLDQGHTGTSASKMLDISSQLLGRWVKEYKADDDGHLFRDNGKLIPEEAEIRKLKD